jgi:phosphoglycolate phosphatase
VQAVPILLIDLDGTLSDSAPGILSSLRRAFADVGVPPMNESTQISLLGPPFYESLPPLVGADRVPAIIDAYRGYYDTAMFDTTLYDGMLDVLTDLGARDVTLAVATSKPEAYAVPIVEHLGVAGFFATIGGDALDGSRDTKAKVIAEVLRRLGSPDPADVLMLGDRSHDVDGARAHGIDCLGAGWGYGSASELDGTVEVFTTPRALLAQHERLFGERDAATA